MGHGLSAQTVGILLVVLISQILWTRFEISCLLLLLRQSHETSNIESGLVLQLISEEISMNFYFICVRIWELY